MSHGEDTETDPCVHFALLGRNPRCGCPLAIDIQGSPEAHDDFLRRGLLLEFLSPETAEALWSEARFPCKHSGRILREEVVPEPDKNGQDKGAGLRLLPEPCENS